MSAKVLFSMYLTSIENAVLTNAFGLRTNLFLDTKIHTWSNLQNGQIVQRAELRLLQPRWLLGSESRTIKTSWVTTRPDKANV